MSAEIRTTEVTERMQRDWNERAREDAHFYVAFGRRDQEDEEFFETGAEVVHGLEWELRRFPAGANRRAWRALEIGCGPGRLMRPMSRHFGEIHGIDVSDEMIRRAAANLQGIAHAHVHHTSGADLAPFADESFQFVYSYAVFQHIPSREVVMQYLREARRVLRPAGLLRAQINGLDQHAKQFDTWSGVRISADEVRQFARENDMQLLALEGTRTQYMWTTMRKRTPGWWEGTPSGRTRVRRLTNAHKSEPVVPASGRFASVTAWIEYLPPDCDLNHLTVCVGGLEATPCYIGPPESDGLQQVNILLPKLGRTGLVPVDLLWNRHRLCEPVYLRVIPPGPQVPFVLSVTDGINMLSGTRIVTRTFKVTVEDVPDPDSFHATVSGIPVTDIDIFCADPLPPRYEINCRVPEAIPPGAHVLTMSLGVRALGSVTLDVAS
jgi:ubiquinone/menaquinone biosynthesis C-methylase UbiE